MKKILFKKLGASVPIPISLLQCIVILIFTVLSVFVYDNIDMSLAGYGHCSNYTYDTNVAPAWELHAALIKDEMGAATKSNDIYIALLKPFDNKILYHG